jgi:ADP-ribose pyrophosphatase YjhB (NUDIX family)
LSTKKYAEVLGIESEVLRARFLADAGYATAKVGVDGAAFDDDGRVLLIRRADDDTWALVGGWCDPGETPQDAITREFAEEVGAEARIEQLVGAYGVPASVSNTTHGLVAVVYLCSVATRAFTPAPHEVVEVAWHDIDAVPVWHHAHESFARAAREVWAARGR